MAQHFPAVPIIAVVRAMLIAVVVLVVALLVNVSIWIYYDTTQGPLGGPR